MRDNIPVPGKRLRLVTPLLCLALGAADVRADDEPDFAYSRRLSDLVNEYRTQRGLPPLSPDAQIAVLARRHSDAMARAGALSHDDFRARVRGSGFAVCVENVGWNYPTPAAQLDGWRASAGHDRNLLDARVTRMGIGVVGGYVTFIACGR